MHKYTPEEIAYLTENVKGHSYEDLKEMFNKHFGLQLTWSQISGTLKRHGLTNGRDCRMKPGNTPFNKGLKGVTFGGKETQFKKGNRPHNYKPIGTERVNGDDYVDVKIADPKTWKGKHIIIWEEANGSPVPKGHVVIFGDGDRRNFEPVNLILVTREQLARLNQNGLIQNDADLTRTGIIIADLYSKISKRKGKKR